MKINLRLTLFLAISLFLSCMKNAFPQETMSEAQQLFTEGRTNYNEGKYLEAIQNYEKIINSGKVSGNIYYNLGNAYYKSGNSGKAILNYERARLLMPRDQDLRFNLRFIKAQVREPSFKESMLGQLFGQLAGFWTMSELVWICVFILLAMAAGHILFLYFHLSAGVLRGWILICVFTISLFTAAVINKHNQKNNAIMLDDSQVFFEPRSNATAYFNSVEGEKVKLLRDEKNWVKIRRKDGKMGWVNRGTVERIVP